MCDACDATKQLIQEWVDKQGHDKCHYYPEIFEQLCSLHGVCPGATAYLPPRKEFRDGCMRYEEQIYVGSMNHCDGKRIGD